MLTEDQWRIINYLNFKIECLADQEDYGIAVDISNVKKSIEELEAQKEPIIEKLKEAMPKVPKITKKSRPKVTHKKDGSLSSHGEKWYALLREHKLPVTYSGEVEVITGYEEPNPSSSTQVKEWLFGLGWKPCTYKFSRNKETGDEKETPQVRYSTASHPRKGELTDSVVRLKDVDPSISYLEGITMINHRLGIFEGLIKSIRPEFKVPTVAAGAGGFTNTLRFKHRVPVVNLPKVGVPWGKEIRSSFVCQYDEIFCGSDMVSLESTTKRHYMKPIDPEYVEEMSHPDFDEHLDLAVHAGVITKEQALQHAKGEINLKHVRTPYKTTNYSAVYGVGPPTLSRTLGVSVKEAAKLLEDYWKRNWAVKEVAKQQFVRTIKDGTMWLKNPVSGFFHSLRYEKDIFSTLNQSTGVYCFDTWVAFCKAMGVTIPMQYHDEILARCKKVDLEETKAKLLKAIELTNKKINLNVPLGIDIQTGMNYADVH